jgi:hypothetical protein
MKSRFSLILSSLVLSGFLFGAAAEKMFSGKIGMTWPRELLSTGIPTGDAEVNYGIIIDKKVAFGVSGNFLWNAQAKEAQIVDTSNKNAGTHYKTVSAQQSYMFPIMGFIQIDPVPKLIVHPVARFQIGYNSMIYRYTETDESGGTKPLSPYFYGLIIKFGADALYDLGERSSLFLGMDYRWAGTKTVSNTNGLFDKRNMGGIGLCAGFRVIL